MYVAQLVVVPLVDAIPAVAVTVVVRLVVKVVCARPDVLVVAMLGVSVPDDPAVAVSMANVTGRCLAALEETTKVAGLAR